MASFVYASWNMKNLSQNSLVRQYHDFGSGLLQENVVAYTNMFKNHNIDLLGILEVTLGTGQEAVKILEAALQANLHTGIGSLTTQNRTFKTRKGEYAAIIHRNTVNSDGFQIDPTQTTEELLQQTTSLGTTFLNRVPVLFKMKLAKPAGKELQLITWHAPQPKHVDPNNALKALSQSIMDLVGTGKLDSTLPVMMSGDFNFDTGPSNVLSWNTFFFLSSTGNLAWDNYLRAFKTTIAGNPTTLVAKDPATYANKPRVVVDFDDLLANAYDTVMINETALKLHTASLPAVVNHIKEAVADNKVPFVYKDPSKPDSTQLLIKNANKISDHCAIVCRVEFK